MDLSQLDDFHVSLAVSTQALVTLDSSSAHLSCLSNLSSL
jgi:hypothetical protein